MNEGKMAKTAALVLAEIADRGVPDSPHLWPTILEGLSGEGRRATGPFPGKLVWTGLVVVLFLAFAGAVNAAGPTLGRFFGLTGGGEHVGESALAEDVKLAQTIDGFTVAVDYVYADHNQLLVGINVEGEAGLAAAVRVAWLGLAHDDSTVFPWRYVETPCVVLEDGKGGVCSKRLIGPQESLASPPLEPQPTTNAAWWAAQAWGLSDPRRVLVFDAPLQGMTSDSLRLRLLVHLQPAQLDPLDADRLRDLVQGRPDAGTVKEPVSGDFLVRPFVFEFDASLAAGRRMELHQTVAAAGVRITLEEVLVTPSLTRLVLHIEPPEPLADAVPVVVLRTPVTVITGSPGTVSGQMNMDLYTPQDGTWILTVPEFLGDDRGEWMLFIAELTDPSGLMDLGLGEHLPGPWVFSFTVP